MDERIATSDRFQALCPFDGQVPSDAVVRVDR